ncbi:hypothetical protein BCR37DRAFT_378204 [Protomyces lactucae-debilis]|uniref:Uncharacterized protein n=1 Tax=Protomyces lactucae-debilis TaxID=2754530 RepID=A0A1Y2FKU9_PROLT|nr:uncharacterized protein BCR37DRAFT_378204 [Protomyces lactucae-debilis]ORY84207.1 hypothetical protein BCR37DRAFT_378204 [Protomyces lactucae-debilis]
MRLSLRRLGCVQVWSLASSSSRIWGTLGEKTLNGPARDLEGKEEGPPAAEKKKGRVVRSSMPAEQGPGRTQTVMLPVSVKVNHSWQLLQLAREERKRTKGRCVCAEVPVYL